MFKAVLTNAAFAFVTLVAVTPAAAQQRAQLCTYLVQTYSNAGACPTCSVNVQYFDGGFSLISSNGWRAELGYTTRSTELWVEGVGGGSWGNVGGAFNGQAFEVNFVFNGPVMTMNMNHFNPSLGNVAVNYVCG